MSVADLARALLDQPRWVETRSMLLSERAVVTGLTGNRRHFVARSLIWPLVAVAGRPDAPFIADAAAEVAPRDGVVLVAEEHADHAAIALPRWQRHVAVIHAWPGGVLFSGPPPGAEARVLMFDEIAALTHVPRRHHEELRVAATCSPVVGAFAGGAPVAFGYACAITETLFDISIETLEGFRRRGLAMKAVRCLITLMVARGKSPVWGAAEDDAASLAMAATLGFEPVERHAYFTLKG